MIICAEKVTAISEKKLDNRNRNSKAENRQAFQTLTTRNGHRAFPLLKMRSLLGGIFLTVRKATLKIPQ